MQIAIASIPYFIHCLVNFGADFRSLCQSFLTRREQEIPHL